MAKINFLGNIESSEIVNRFSPNDLSLTGIQIINSNFNPDNEYIEYVIYDAANNFLNIDYLYNNYKLPTDSNLNVSGSYPQLDIDPVDDLKSYSSYGEFITQYNFFKPFISDSLRQDLFIKEISPDRTEIKVASVSLSKADLENQTKALIDDKNSVSYLKTYLLNFGLNNVQVITNVALDTSNPSESYIYFKLYEPLPLDIVEKTSFWVVEEITNSHKFNINLSSEIIPDPLPQLKGPNFDIEVVNKNTLPTKYESHNTLLQFTGSSIQTILNNLDQTSIDINVDYTDFANFTRFSSAQKRIENFYYKVKQIEDYNSFITTYTPFVATTASLQLQINQYSASINDIVSKFDGYESYLYFQTGSNTYPHSNNTVPYTQQSTGSAAALAWYNDQIELSNYYDTYNQDNLIYLIPEYLRIDPNNTPYFTFVNMIGQYFDNIYIYLKSVTDVYKSYNNLEEGVSKDLVYYALQDLGVNVYNSSEDDDLNTYTIAVSGSNVPSKDLVAELYKRIYHNIPLLFKGKGSRRGMQEFITTFGITGSILNIKEYGGDTNTHASLVDYSNNKVRIIDNTIYSSSYNGLTGSILSPLIKLATDNTYTNYKNDSDRVDISFSPYNQIDTTISASIASTYPTFSIDDYIGDPRNASQTEYGVLNSIRQTAINSSFTYKYDINGFIQLIKFFDNTLFKMLKSYVPAKANLNEGITIRQQALERIKFKRNEPSGSEQTVYDAEYSAPEITEDNTYLYNDLAGDKAAFYTGDITGSYINIGEDYAVQENPYTLPTGSINQNTFIHSDYNVTLNNVSSSLISSDRLKSEEQPYTSSKLLVPVELQDSYESLTSYRLSRHDGIKLTAYSYNEYTSSTDISYGNSPVIDYLGSNMYEFDWGGGGYPENSFGGSFSMGNIYTIGNSKDDVNIIAPDDDTYYWYLERNLYYFNTIKQRSYSGATGLKTKIQTLYPGLALQDASYWISSYFNDGVGSSFVYEQAHFYMVGFPPTINNPYIDINENLEDPGNPYALLARSFPVGTRNSSGTQLTGSSITASIAMNDLSSSLNNKDRWFVSLYNGYGKISGTSTFTGPDGLKDVADGTDLNQVGYPFEIDRVERIKVYNTYTTGSLMRIYLKDSTQTILSIIPTGNNIAGVPDNEHIIGKIGYGGNNYKGYGMLLTKGLPSNQVVAYGDKWQNFSIPQGYITVEYPKPIITQNANYISKTYGNKPA
jgi:hypothetical protein